MTVTPPEPTPPLRIGDAERNAAADALQQHLTSGRLTIDEFADRSGVVAAARTQPEIDAVFIDLPPIAGAPGAAGRRATAPARPAWPGAQSGHQAPPRGNRAVLIGVVSAMPFIALILFFVTRQWLFFLLIPLAGAILGPAIGSGGSGTGGSDSGGASRRNRDRRR